MRWLFYDLETSGLCVSFEQILQYAYIETDDDLNMLSEHSAYAQYRKDVMPSPEAAIIHCIADVPKDSAAESDVIKKLHHEFNQTNTITLGYNTLGFDDEFMRFGFYRNLLTPYTHQYANNCTRRDLYPITVLYYLFANDALEWPQKDGQPSLKLDAISEKNNLASGNAHDALVDVRATIALAKKLKQYDEKIWQFANMQFNKSYDSKRISLLEAHKSYAKNKIALLICGRFGAKRNFMRPAILLGTHRHYKNQTVWLPLDNETMLNANKDNFLECCHTINRKPCEQIFMLPFQTQYSEKLTQQAQMNLDNSIKWLNANTACVNLISEHALNYKYPAIQNIDVYAELYQCGFPTPQITKLMREFHAADNQHKRIIRDKLPQPYRELAGRLILLNCSNLSDNEHSELDEYITSSQQGRINNKGKTSDNLEAVLKRCENISDLEIAQTKALKFCKKLLND
jgi:exodeoxyribonuclease I